MARRGKRLVLLAHCILNQNAVVEPLARRPGALEGIVRTCLDAGVGMMQLPCPEIVARGPRRAQAERPSYDTAEYRARCRALLEPVRAQAEAYRSAGYEIVGLLAIGDSPSCGLLTTHDGRAVPGRGVFMEELLAIMPELEGRALQVPRRYAEDAEVTARFDEELRDFCTGSDGEANHGGHGAK